MAHRAGFVAIVGRPNVGKSTLLNRVLGEKVAIVSPRPQTTRSRILGVLTRSDAQVAFWDTPGIHRARGALNRFMVEQALGTLDEVDLILHLVEPGVTAQGTVDIGEEQRWIAEQVLAAKKPAVLAINKIDTVQKPLLLPVMAAWKDLGPWEALYPISALTGDGVDGLVDLLVQRLPEGPPMFPPDTLTDQAEREVVAELVREAVIRYTRQELPYATAVVVEQFDESERAADARAGRPGLVRIEATIYVERDSQKGIVIGKGGAMLKKIGSAARQEIERLLGCRVWLGLHVKVEEHWTRSPAALARMGYKPKS